MVLKIANRTASRVRITRSQCLSRHSALAFACIFVTGTMVITWNCFEKASILPAEGRRRESLEDLDEKFKLPILLAEWASKPMMVGYAISLIKCGDHQSTPEGLIDAALVMRHSIHMTSVRNPKSGSKYDYKMYAIVHRNAEPCSHILQQAGFEIIIADPPLDPKDIRGEFVRKHIDQAWCCGSDEFIKLYAYMIPERVVVHVDIDFAFLKPMDELFDAIVYDANSSEGQAARQLIPLERPNEAMPEQIDAFITRDWPQARPGRKPGFQAGFIVLRPNADVIQEVVGIVLEGNYTEGFGHDAGWHSSGHGIYVGAMAMQGVMAYYYDYVRPNNVVELNQCRYNWMGMDVLYRAQPNFTPRHHKVGKCRNNLDYCEDCMTVDLELVKNVHYTVCRKPWNCISEGTPSGRDLATNKARGAIDTNTGNLEQCMKVVKIWHEHRADLERKLYKLTKDKRVLASSKGDYKNDTFMGHCTEEGGKGYIKIQAASDSFDQLYRLYD